MNQDMKFNGEELDVLCNLYMDGRLTRADEKALLAILESSENLTPLAAETLSLIKLENRIFVTQPVKKKSVLLRYSWAAAIIIALGVIAFPLVKSRVESENETITVWENGKKITDKEAIEKAFERQNADMEMIRQMMKQQREMIKTYYATNEIDE